MLGLLIAATLTVFQPESIHFEAGLEPGVKYEFDCRWAHEFNGEWVQNTVGYVSLELRSSLWSGDRLLATIDVFGLPVDQEFYDQTGLTRDDLCVDIVFTRSDFELTGIKDWELVRDDSIQITQRYMDILAEQDLVDEDTIQRATVDIAAKLETEELCMQYYSGLISPYFTGYNWTLTENEMFDRDTDYPNPFGGKPLPGYERTYIDDNPKTEETIEYRTNMYLDTLGAMRAMRPELTKLGYSRDEIEKSLKYVEVDYSYYWAYDESRSLITMAYVEGLTILPHQDSHIIRRSWELIELEGDEN